MSELKDEKLKEIENEANELFQEILKTCGNHSFYAIKIALLLARDYVISKETIKFSDLLKKEESNG